MLLAVLAHLGELCPDESVGEGGLADPAVAHQDDVAVEPLLHHTSHDHRSLQRESTPLGNHS